MLEISVKCWSCGAYIEKTITIKKGNFKLKCEICGAQLGEVRVRKRNMHATFPLLTIRRVQEIQDLLGRRQPVFVVRLR
jgi:hypothetical protein